MSAVQVFTTAPISKSIRGYILERNPSVVTSVGCHSHVIQISEYTGDGTLERNLLAVGCVDQLSQTVHSSSAIWWLIQHSFQWRHKLYSKFFIFLFFFLFIMGFGKKMWYLCYVVRHCLETLSLWYLQICAHQMFTLHLICSEKKSCQFHIYNMSYVLLSLVGKMLI